ncbi:DUF190 domain-containing protein [Effusibacillus pohliae]|uniref:DUF190 domain-containing protein n=1 Tax=Effusibacillus pohliae TaxID=232270 RepID=UPI000368179F|nr:DUF190 domain-containing protein [Effusibacillus pohliae]
MANQLLLNIVLGEQELDHRHSQPLYTEIMQFLWKKGLAGATVARADAGIDENDTFREMVLEDVPFNNLPIVIEAVDTQERVRSLLPELKSMIPHGEIVTIEAFDILKGAWPMNETEYLMLKIYVKEKSDWFGRALYQELLHLLNEHQLIWSTVTRGIVGFGKDHVIHKQSIFSLSSQVPVVIEAVGRTEVVRRLVPELEKRVQEGLLIAIPVQVVMDR